MQNCKRDKFKKISILKESEPWSELAECEKRACVRDCERSERGEREKGPIIVRCPPTRVIARERDDEKRGAHPCYIGSVSHTCVVCVRVFLWWQLAAMRKRNK